MITYIQKRVLSLPYLRAQIFSLHAGGQSPCRRPVQSTYCENQILILPINLFHVKYIYIYIYVYIYIYIFLIVSWRIRYSVFVRSIINPSFLDRRIFKYTMRSIAKYDNERTSMETTRSYKMKMNINCRIKK